MHSPIAAESKHNCDSRANYWQLRLSLCGINQQELCHVQQVGPMQSKGSFVLNWNREKIPATWIQRILRSSLLGAIRDLPRNVAVARAAALWQRFNCAAAAATC